MTLKMKVPKHSQWARTALLALSLTLVSYAEEGPLAEYNAWAVQKKQTLKALEQQNEAETKRAQQVFESKLSQLKQQQTEQVGAARRVLESLESQKEAARREMQARHDIETQNEDQESTFFEARMASEETNAQTNLENALRNLPSGAAGRAEEQNRRADYSRALTEIRKAKDSRRELLSKNRKRRYDEQRKMEEVWNKSISSQRSASSKVETSWTERLALEERSLRSQMYTNESNRTEEIRRLSLAIERSRYDAEQAQQTWDRIHPVMVDEYDKPMDRKQLKVGRYDAVGKYAAPESGNTAARTVATGTGSRMASFQLSNGQVLLIPDWAEWYWVRDQVLYVSVAHPKEITAQRLAWNSGQTNAASDWQNTLNALKTKWLKDRIEKSAELLNADLAKFSESTKRQLREKLGDELALRVESQLIEAITSGALKAKADLESWRTQVEQFVASMAEAEKEIQNRKIDWKGKRIGDCSVAELEERFRSPYNPERLLVADRESAWETQWQAFSTTPGLSLPQWEARASLAAEQTLTLSDKIKSYHSDLANWLNTANVPLDAGEKALKEFQDRRAAKGQTLIQEAFPAAIPTELSSRFQTDNEKAVREWKNAIEGHRAQLAEKNRSLQKALDSYASELILRLVDGATFEELRPNWEEKVASLWSEREAFESTFVKSFQPWLTQAFDPAQVEESTKLSIAQYRNYSTLKQAIETNAKERDQAHAARLEAFEAEWVKKWKNTLVSLYVETFETEGTLALQKLVEKHFGTKSAEHFSTPVRERWVNHPNGLANRKAKAQEWDKAVETERSRLLALYQSHKAQDDKEQLECLSLPWEKSPEKLLELQALWQARETEIKLAAELFSTRLLTEWKVLKPKWDSGPSVPEEWETEMRSYPRIAPARDFPALKRGQRFDLSEYLVFQDPVSKREIFLGEVGKVYEAQGAGSHFAVVADWVALSKNVSLGKDPDLQDRVPLLGPSKPESRKVLLFRGAELVGILPTPRPNLHFGKLLVHRGGFILPLERAVAGSVDLPDQRIRVKQLAYELDLNTPKLEVVELPQEDLKPVEGLPFP